MNQTKKIILADDEKQEIQSLKKQLQDHKKIYADFKSFVKTCDEGIKIADALLNDDFKTFRKYPLKYSQHTAEKMRGIESLSTYKKTSNICKFLSAHTHSGGICEKCYAEKSIKLYKSSLTPALIYNTLLLKYIDIDPQQIPYTNSKYFRFESFSVFDNEEARAASNMYLCKNKCVTCLKCYKKSKNIVYIAEKLH